MSRLILKKESFGGTFVDTKVGWMDPITPEDYEIKKEELQGRKKAGENVHILDVTERGYPLLKGATSSPNSVFWEITKRCNGYCTDCFMEANSPRWSKDESTFADIEKITQQLVDLGVFTIRLTGGEPTTRPDFFDIADLLAENDMQLGLNTNGFFGEDLLEKILERPIKDIRISVDGPKDINDAIRGEGSYDKAMKTIRAISGFNKGARAKGKEDDVVDLTVNVVLMRSNQEYIEHMIEVASELQSKVSFGLLRVAGRAQVEDMLSPQEVLTAAYRVHKMRSELGLPKNMVRINYDVFCEEKKDGKGAPIKRYSPSPFDNSKCPLASHGLGLDAYSRVSICGYLIGREDMLGEDVRGKDILNIWHNSPVFVKARSITREGCKDCTDYKTKCNGGCPAMPYLLGGDMNGKDPYCIRDVRSKGPQGR